MDHNFDHHMSISKSWYSNIGTARIRHQCIKTAALSYHRCLIKTDTEKMNIWIWIITLTTRCLKVRVNVGTQTMEQHLLDTDAGKQPS